MHLQLLQLLLLLLLPRGVARANSAVTCAWLALRTQSQANRDTAEALLLVMRVQFAPSGHALDAIAAVEHLWAVLSVPRPNADRQPQNRPLQT